MPYAPAYLHLVIPNVRFEALLYGRNSSNDFVGIAGARDSVDDQLATGRTLCRSHDWAITYEFKDSDASASRHARKARSDFEDLLTAITHDTPPAGVRRIVVAYEASRLHRSLESYLRLREACTQAGVLLCYNGTVYDLSRREDRKTTAEHAIAAEDEADAIQDRNVRTTTLEAQAGKPHGRLPFGYAREYAVVGGRSRCIRQFEDPVRGPVVLKAFQHIDAGMSVLSLLRWMNSTPDAARPDGAPWTSRTVRILLTNRAYLGERLHLGVHSKGTWEPIQGLHTPQGQAMFNRVVKRLRDPSRRQVRGTEAVHLLTYIARCGEHGDDHFLSSAPGRAGRKGRLLACKPAGDVSITEKAAEATVEEAVVHWFSQPEARAALAPGDGDVGEKVEQAQRRINAFEEQLSKSRALAREFDDATGRFRLSPESLAELEARLEPLLEVERKKLHGATGLSPLVQQLLMADDPQVVWNGRPATESDPGATGLSVEQRRTVLREVVTVRVYKTRRLGSNRADLSRIRLAFVGEPGFVPLTGRR